MDKKGALKNSFWQMLAVWDSRQPAGNIWRFLRAVALGRKLGLGRGVGSRELSLTKGREGWGGGCLLQDMRSTLYFSSEGGNVFALFSPCYTLLPQQPPVTPCDDVTAASSCNPIDQQWLSCSQEFEGMPLRGWSNWHFQNTRF